MCDYYLSLGTETTPHHWTDMKLAIWTTKAWAKKRGIGESDNNTKNIERHGSVGRRMIVGVLRSHWSKMDKLAQFTSVRNVFGNR